MSAIRSDRLNEELKKTISEIVRELKDPRRSDMTTMTDAQVTRDLRYATVRVSVYDRQERVRRETVAALNHAAGFIAREVGQRMQIRRVPALRFVLDDSIAYSVHISDILNKLHIGEAGEGADGNAGGGGGMPEDG